MASVKSKPAAKVYEDGPWAQKWVSGEHKRLAFEAAKRAEVDVGIWLGEAIAEKVRRERESAEAESAGESKVVDVFPPRSRAVAMIDPMAPLSVDELAQAYELAKRMAEDQAAATLGGTILGPKSKLRAQFQRRLLDRVSG